jgi:3-(3-hydroxy-phenyl)propionate hydroxylase
MPIADGLQRRRALMPKSFRVLLVGAGPVGMVTALAFAQRGFDVTVLEIDALYDEKPRAATTHSSTLDMMATLGVADEVVRQGLISERFQHWDRVTGKLVAQFDFSCLKGETAFPFAVQCESHKTVNICEAALAKYSNARVLRGHEVIAVGQNAAGVWAECKTANGTVRFEGDYLVGTDGARSVVRKACEISFEGYTFEERFVGMTTPFDFEREYGVSNRNYFADPERFVLLFKVAGNDMTGMWRVVSPATTTESDEALLSDASIQARLQHFFPNAKPYDIRYRGYYKFHQRVAGTFRHDRMFLAGDAAHVNNPAGGLGMNSGIHDGMELAELFEFVQQQTVMNKKRLEERDAVVRQAALDELTAICDDPVRHKAFLMRASLIDSVRKARGID